jgi:hypothetical protein
VEVGMLWQQGDTAVLNGGRPVRGRFAGRRVLEALPQGGARGDMAQIEGILKEGILPKRFNMVIIALALRQQPHIRRDVVAVGNVRVLASGTTDAFRRSLFPNGKAANNAPTTPHPP